MLCHEYTILTTIEVQVLAFLAYALYFYYIWLHCHDAVWDSAKAIKMATCGG